MKYIITEEQLNVLLSKCKEGQYFNGSECVNYPIGSKIKNVTTKKEYDRLMEIAESQAAYYNIYLKLKQIEPEYIFGKYSDRNKISSDFARRIKEYQQKHMINGNTVLDVHETGNINVKNGKLFKDISTSGPYQKYSFDEVTQKMYIVVRLSKGHRNIPGHTKNKVNETQYRIIKYTNVPPTFPKLVIPKPNEKPINKNPIFTPTNTTRTPKPELNKPIVKTIRPTNFTVTWRDNSGKQNVHYFDNYDEWKTFVDNNQWYSSIEENKNKTQAEALYSGTVKLSIDKQY